MVLSVNVGRLTLCALTCPIGNIRVYSSPCVVVGNKLKMDFDVKKRNGMKGIADLWTNFLGTMDRLLPAEMLHKRLSLLLKIRNSSRMNNR